jgi:hypothetical protein
VLDTKRSGTNMGMRQPGDPPRVGDQFQSTVRGVPVILQIDKIIAINRVTSEATLKTHIVRRIHEEEGAFS